MTEPAWRHIDTVTEEMFQEGSWLSRYAWSRNDSLRSIKEFCKQERTPQVYGPIPAPPKEPPKLRRFTAKYKRDGRIVSGVSYGECATTFSTGDSGAACWDSHCDMAILTDIHWLDPE